MKPRGLALAVLVLLAACGRANTPASCIVCAADGVADAVDVAASATTDAPTLPLDASQDTAPGIDPAACGALPGCDDGNPCSLDLCQEGTCTHLVDPPWECTGTCPPPGWCMPLVCAPKEGRWSRVVQGRSTGMADILLPDGGAFLRFFSLIMRRLTE